MQLLREWGGIKRVKAGGRGVKMTLEYLWNALFKLQYQTFLHPSLAFTGTLMNFLKKRFKFTLPVNRNRKIIIETVNSYTVIKEKKLFSKT